MPEGEIKSRKYGPPKVPCTPSGAINNMLQTRCGKAFNNPVKAAVAYYVCYVFTAINYVYEHIYTDKSKPSQPMWMASTGIIAVGSILGTTLAYNMVIISIFVFLTLFFYFAILFALAGIGLGVAGIFFFDKEPSKTGGLYRPQTNLITSDGGIDSQAHGASELDNPYKKD